MPARAQHVADANAVVRRAKRALGEEGNRAHPAGHPSVCAVTREHVGHADEPRYRERSLWLDQLPEPLAPRASLPGDRDCDVAIVGAGFTGLWTAYYLKRAQPDLRVVVLEREIAGFGPAGRNGGWVSAGIAGSWRVYAERSGADGVLRATRETHRAVDEIGAVV